MATFLPTIPAVESPAVFVKALQNNGTSTSAAQYVSFGHCFQKGQMTDAGMTATIGSDTYPCQVNVKTGYADGSVCHAIITLQWPAVAAGTISWGQFAPSAAPSGSVLVLSSAIGSTTLSISLTATALPDWQPSTVYPLNALIKPTAGNAGGYTFQFPSNSNNYSLTSGTTEPTWPQTEGASVEDGSSEASPYWYNIGVLFAGTITQDLIAAVKDSTDLWLSGPLVVQGRAMVLPSNPASLPNVTVNSSLPSWMRFLIDITAFKDGTIVHYDRAAHTLTAAVASGGAATVSTGLGNKLVIAADGTALIEGQAGAFVKADNNGTVTINGNLLVAGTISSTSGTWGSGDLTVTGMIKATEDIVASTAGNNISVTSHVHAQGNDSHGDAEQSTDAPTANS